MLYNLTPFVIEVIERFLFLKNREIELKGLEVTVLHIGLNRLQRSTPCVPEPELDASGRGCIAHRAESVGIHIIFCGHSVPV